MIKYDLGKFYLDLFLKAPSPRDVDFLLTQMMPCHESEEENLSKGAWEMEIAKAERILTN